MKIRPALGALCAAVALTAGLAISAGTAHADTTCVPSIAGVTPVVTCPTVTTTDPVTTTPIPTTTPVPVPPWHHGGGGGDIVCTTATSCTQNGLPYTGGVTACATFPCRLDANGNLDHDPTHPGGPFGGHFHPGFPGYPGTIGGGVLGIPGLNLLNGNTIVLTNGQQVNVCTQPSWQPFYNRYSPYFGSWRDQLNELRYQQLLAQASCANNSGFNGLTLVNGQWIDLSQYGVVGGQRVSVCQYSNWNDFNGFAVRRFGSHFSPFGSRFGGYLGGNGWNQLRVRANCGPQVVVVPGGTDTTTVEQVPPAPVVTAPPVPAAAPEAAPAPLSGSGHYRYPSSAPDTGDGSLAGR